MKKVLDLNAQHTAKVHEATTWSFSMEGERYFEGTRSFVTAAGIEKPLMNAYRAFARLGRRRLAATSDQAADISDISALGNGLPEEIDVIAGSDGDEITILVWRHTDDQYAADPATARVDLEVTGWIPARGPFSTSGSTTVTATVTRSGRSSAHPRIRRLNSSPPSPPAKVSSDSPTMWWSRSTAASRCRWTSPDRRLVSSC